MTVTGKQVFWVVASMALVWTGVVVTSSGDAPSLSVAQVAYAVTLGLWMGISQGGTHDPLTQLLLHPTPAIPTLAARRLRLGYGGKARMQDGE